jgi:GT2 family glycosyltransferase
MSSSTESPLPEASLIIPSRNRGRLLVETVESVLAGDQRPAEIVVVDQSDEPNGDLEALAREESPSLRYLWSRGSGVSKARNRGIHEATHDVLAFIDDDVRVTSDWFRNLVRALCAAGPDAVVTGRVLPEASPVEGGFVPSTIDHPEPVVYAGRIESDILYSNNMAVWRSIIDAVGPFDERFGGGTRFKAAEDNEFGFRVLEAGFRIHYTPDATLYHRAWRSRGDYHALSWRYGYGQGAYYAKHTHLRDRHMLGRLRRDLGHRSVRMLRFARRQPHRAVGQLVYIAGLVAGALHWTLSGTGRA